MIKLLTPGHEWDSAHELLVVVGVNKSKHYIIITIGATPAWCEWKSAMWDLLFSPSSAIQPANLEINNKLTVDLRIADG